MKQCVSQRTPYLSFQTAGADISLAGDNTAAYLSYQPIILHTIVLTTSSIQHLNCNRQTVRHPHSSFLFVIHHPTIPVYKLNIDLISDVVL